jgi:hypothetical protein
MLQHLHVVAMGVVASLLLAALLNK